MIVINPDRCDEVDNASPTTEPDRMTGRIETVETDLTAPTVA
jgi:hypothetical protein